MKTFTLSGGNYGGHKVSTPDTAVMICVQAPGVQWFYDLSLNPGELADFCGCIYATELGESVTLNGEVVDTKQIVQKLESDFVLSET